MEENNQVQQPQNTNPQPQGESKTAIGFVCAFFLGLIGLIIGICCFPEGSFERKTFMKGFWWTFGACAIAGVVLSIFSLIIAFVLVGANGALI